MQGWQLRRMLSYVNRVCGKPYRPKDVAVRDLCAAAGVTWPEARSSSGEDAEGEDESYTEEGEEEELEEGDEEVEVEEGWIAGVVFIGPLCAGKEMPLLDGPSSSSPVSPPAPVPVGGSKDEVLETPPPKGLTVVGMRASTHCGRCRCGPSHSTESISDGRFLNCRLFPPNCVA